jgi:hypothetical protein
MRGCILLIILFSQISCAMNYRTSDCSFNYSVHTADHIAIGEGELLESVSSVLKFNRASRYKIEIVLFGYSSGKEVFSYSGDSSSGDSSDDMGTGIYPGRLEALVKIREGDKLKEAVFIKATGKTRDELIKNLAGEIRRLLCR